MFVPNQVCYFHIEYVILTISWFARTFGGPWKKSDPIYFKKFEPWVAPTAVPLVAVKEKPQLRFRALVPFHSKK